MIGCKKMIVAAQLDEAVGVLEDNKGNVTVLGGGTDLFVAARMHSVSAL